MAEQPTAQAAPAAPVDPFQQQEDHSGLRWTWNFLPANRQDAARVIIPPACLYTPLKRFKDLTLCEYQPLMCPGCHALMNPYCQMDYKNRIWTCPFCHRHNPLSEAYRGCSAERPPAEVLPQNLTVEYNVTREAVRTSFFLYVIDTCVPPKELQTLKTSLSQSLEFLPENCHVGLITFGTTVQMHELGHTEISKAFVFRGDQAPTLDGFKDQIGLGHARFAQQEHQANYVRAKFVVPLADFEMNLTEILEDIHPDPWPVKPNSRDRRCSGVALSIATSLAEIGFLGIGGRIMMFSAGPCTQGDGMVVGLSKKEFMRLHNDIQNDTAEHYKAATAFYYGLTQRLVRNGHIVDVFSANLDQVGMLEMSPCVDHTGGVMILSDSFSNPVFEESFRLFLERDEADHLKMAFNGTLEVNCGPGIRICGALGPLNSMNQKTARVSDTEIGYGNTSSWKMNGLTETTTVAIFFDIQRQATGPSGAQQQTPFQFVTAYQHPSGTIRLRVTTTSLQFLSHPQAYANLAQGFDQEAAAVIMTRLAVFKTRTDYLFDVLRWLDRSLIRLTRRFGEYQKDQPGSLRVGQRFNLFPAFMYHLRRSHFLRIFNSSPDETCFYRFYLNRETCSQCLTMIQPRMALYYFEKKQEDYEVNVRNVSLDSDSLRDDGILLMDCFDTVLIHNGESIATWRDSGFHEKPKHATFRQLLFLPKSDAKALVDDKRFPYPRFIDCDEGSSQARILYAKINPSRTYKTSAFGEGQGASFRVLTDESSLQFFNKHLRELVVAVEKDE